MNRPLHLVLLGALSLGLMGSGGGWRTMLSPGHLVAGHADIAGQCDKCHAVLQGIPDERCLSCHDDLEMVLPGQSPGFHATVVDQDCIACHVDHTGPKGTSTRPESLASFDHATTGFRLGGRHRRLDCEDCHEGPVADMAPTCGGCHDDPHVSALGPDCAACHVDLGFDAQLKTLAAHRIDTTGRHDGLGCEDCHLHGEHPDIHTVCADCHDQEHGGTQSDCSSCHQVSGFKPASFDHGPCGCAFPGKHQTAPCLACHEGFTFTDTPGLCSGCHVDERPHEPLGECSRCHTAISWSEGRFDHDTAAFALTGSHLGVSCDQCHADGFRGVPRECAGCHGPAGMEAHGDFGACESCHQPTGFVPALFDHADVSFPLVGRHATLPCQECHAQQVEGYRPAD